MNTADSPGPRTYVREGFTCTWHKDRDVVTVIDTAGVDCGHFYTSPGDTYPDMLMIADEWIDDAQGGTP